jgi:hypothetical protein
MTNNDEGYLIEATQRWHEGRALDAGRIIFEHLSPAMQPLWAAQILRLVLSKGGLLTPLFDEVLYHCRKPICVAQRPPRFFQAEGRNTSS